MAPPEAFLALVHAAVHTRGELTATDYLPAALNVAHRIPDGVKAEDAAGMFIRWIFNEPFQEKDRALWQKLTPDK